MLKVDNHFRNMSEKKFASLIEMNPFLNRQLISNQDNKKLPIYKWFPYKEGFAHNLVQFLIDDYGRSKVRKILDPFAGAGTTLFSAQEFGINSEGIELLPVGQFVYNTRINLDNGLNIKELKQVIDHIYNLDYSKLKENESTNYKHIKITEKAFSKENETNLNKFLNYNNKLESSDDVKQIITFAVFSILEKISYTRKDGQCLRWDKRSQKGSSSFDKGFIPIFKEAINDKLSEIYEDILLYKSKLQFKSDIKSSKSNLITGSTFDELPKLKNEDYDLIISSPPYLNRYDYTRIYALELAFLGVDESQIRNLRQILLSSHVESKGKYEALKEKYIISYGVDLFQKLENIYSSCESLNEIMNILELYKTEDKLNNNGILTMIRNYFFEHVFLIFEMFRVLKKNGVMYYVNDNVRYAGEIIPVDLILSEFAEKLGFEVEKIYILGTGKGNSSQQMGNHGKIELRKCIYKWRKK